MIKESLLALDNIFQNGIVKAMESTNRKSRWNNWKTLMKI
jgi:hypothetical protein